MLKVLVIALFSVLCSNAQTVFVGTFEGADGINGGAIAKTITDDLTKSGIAIEPTEAKADVVVSGRAFSANDKVNIVAKIDGKKAKKILGETQEGPKTDPIEKAASSLATKIIQAIKAL